MSYEFKTHTGATEVVIDDNCGISKFYQIASILTEQLKVNFLSQLDDSDTLDWDFKYKNTKLILHYNIFSGVSIFPQLTSKSLKTDNEIVLEIACFLEKTIQ